MSYKWSLLPYFLFIPVFSAVIFFSTKNMYASALVVEPKIAMNKWSCEGKIDDMAKWEKSKNNLVKANQLHRNDADIVSDLGRMHEFKALTQPAWKPEAKESRNKAISFYHEATKARPTWALAWLNYANAKIMNQEADGQAFDAMRNAFKYGRWQEKVQQKLLWLGVGIWPVLPNDIKEMITEVAKRTIEQNVRIHAMVLMSFRFNWQEKLLSLLTSEEHLAIFNKYAEDPSLRKRVAQQQSKQLVC